MAFGRDKRSIADKVMAAVLDTQDADVVVVRGGECSLLYANRAARERMAANNIGSMGCAGGYATMFDGLCERCTKGRADTLGQQGDYEVEGPGRELYTVHSNTVPWLDERPVSVMFLRNVHEQRTAREKLYRLAYTDSLTGVPNRQRFKEDFEAIVPDIESGRLGGVVAIFDLDNFKSINDTYGHNTGDIMLRRLADHLQADEHFAGHLYRLGGDEFCLFYHEERARFESFEQCSEYYQHLLQKALLSYTMPNIEAECTLSMGVAFFPQHGSATSELLRKADIALYKAKEEGRNRLILFEDRYDNAKKFKDLYINIQPVLTAAGTTYAYEMVDRGNEGAQDDSEVNLDDFDRTVDALNLGEMEGDAKYFISYSAHLLSKPVLDNLPKKKFIIQLHLPETYTNEDIERYAQLRAHGYSLALTGLRKTNYAPALMAIADYCKFEPGAVDPYFQKKIIAENPMKRFIATDVNTAVAFEEAKKRGYKLFQGFFFEQPIVVRKTKDIDPMKVNYLRLLKLTSTDGYVDFSEVSAIIAADVAMSYKLLRLLNSAAVGLKNKVSSIDMAVAYLGEEQLKKWVALLALRGVASDKPLELVRISLIRAQFGELLAPHFNPKRDPQHLFFVGMFSLLHIALDKTKEELFQEIPVAEDIRLSLVSNDGPYSDLVGFFSSYEYANWDEVTAFAEQHRITDSTISEAYINAVKWYNDLASE